MNIITSTDIQNHFIEIAEIFRDTVSGYSEFYDNNTELILILNKINSNLVATMQLMPINLINEAKIIMRSAFETTVLFEYLVEFPKEMKIYKEDNKILQLKTIVSCFNRNIFKEQDVIEAYNCYKDIQRLSDFENISKSGLITYNFKWLNDFLSGKGHNSFKPLSQRTIPNIDKLRNSKKSHADILFKLRLDLYDINSQIIHSNLDTLIKPVLKISNEDFLKEIQEQFKSCICLYKIIFETLEGKFNFNYPNEFYSKITNMCSFLGFKL